MTDVPGGRQRCSLRGPDAPGVQRSGNSRSLEPDRHGEASGHGRARKPREGRAGNPRRGSPEPDHLQVLLFYKAEATKRWTCAVVKRVAEGAFLITAYPTDAIKEGVRIWPK